MSEACPICWRSDGGHDERWHRQERVLDSLPEATARPCVECPWLRTAVRGHLGPNTAEEWTEIAHTDSPIACHMTIDHNHQDWPELRQCAGSAIFRANVFKEPRHPKVARAERDEQRVFSSDQEFIDHHERR